MNYQVDYNKLIIDRKVVYEAPTEIVDVLVTKFDTEVMIIIYDGFRLLPDDYHDITNPKLADPKLQEAINQNVLCLDKEGNILWRIESTLDYPEDHVRFVDNRPGVRQIWVYRRDAREFMVNPQNGKILDWQMGL